MPSRDSRLDKLESQLTPKQAMLLWMAEAHQFQTLEEYAAHMKTQSDEFKIRQDEGIIRPDHGAIRRQRRPPTKSL